MIVNHSIKGSEWDPSSEFQVEYQVMHQDILYMSLYIFCYTITNTDPWTESIDSLTTRIIQLGVQENDIHVFFMLDYNLQNEEIFTNYQYMLPVKDNINLNLVHSNREFCQFLSKLTTPIQIEKFKFNPLTIFNLDEHDMYVLQESFTIKELFNATENDLLDLVDPPVVKKLLSFSHLEMSRIFKRLNSVKTWSASQQPRNIAQQGPRFEQTLMEYQPNPPSAQELIAKVPVKKVDSRIVSCDGGGGALGHPKVYINLDKPGAASCGYCGLRFEQNH